jgi:hypothetical protein
MPLETGTWILNASGIQLQLEIVSVDVRGNVVGILSSPGEPLRVFGFWDEGAQKLVFQVFGVPPSGVISSGGAIYVFTGFLFTDQFRLTGVTGSVVFTLSGYFEVLPAPDQIGVIRATSEKCLFGWYAQIGVG